MDKSFRNNLLKQVGIAVIVMAVLFTGLVLLKNHIKESVAQITDARQELVNRARALNSLSDLRSQYKDSGQRYLNVLSNIVPTRDELIDISSDLQNLANEDNLGFGFSFSGEQKPEGSNLGFIQFNINVVGDNVDEVIGYIERLENFRYLTTIDSIDIRREGDEGGVNLSIQGRVYFQ